LENQKEEQKQKQLYRASINTILENQHSGGAFPASPNYSTYQYAWLRDGSFTAYAMLKTGNTESCKRFLLWVNKTINRYSGKIDELESKIKKGSKTENTDFLPARYTLEGFEIEDDWPAFQIDGYGSWLWCTGEYIRATRDYKLLQSVTPGILNTIRYLIITWQIPCYDCWEEYGERIHTSTLACVYGGLSAAAELAENEDFAKAGKTAYKVRRFILSHIRDGGFTKFINDDGIDASLLWLAVPFKVVAVDSPAMVKTVSVIEEKLLVKGGGVKRYPEDTFYGGGQWILLTCWLAWYYLMAGRGEEAYRLLAWVEEQQDENGCLPEQVPGLTANTSWMEEWRKRWGPVATPLLWSHAMYLVVLQEMKERDRGGVMSRWGKHRQQK